MAQENIYTISRLNNEVRMMLENTFTLVWVEGEISNFAAPHSGHWYFSLKDAAAQVRCAMFRGSSRKLDFTPKDGMHVLIRARVSLYENRGEFQLIAESMEERGEGKLRKAYELLKKKLEVAGLFAADKKKPIPTFPKQIGVVTSATGAAIRDILTVLNRRFHCVPIIIYPTLVQGATAAPTIAQAIQLANQRNECDVLIVARGGGSLEDLWPFNEEIVAHAIFASVIPIVSGVGHEVDFTIADFVADVRAPTPSAAAELVTPDKLELLQTLNRSKQQIVRHLRSKLQNVQERLSWIQKNLNQQHPVRRLRERMQRLDFFEAALAQSVNRLIYKRQTELKSLDVKLHRLSTLPRIQHLQTKMNYCNQQLHNLLLKHLTRQQTALAQAAAKLDALSPLATLTRGYAIATSKQQEVLLRASQVKKGEEINVRLLQGSLTCKVEMVQAD